MGDLSTISEKERKIYDKVIERLLKEQSKVYIEGLKEYLHDGIYFICLSSSNKINSLWAHYANNHDGICIEYDVKKCDNDYLKDLCFKIEYVEKSDNTKDIKNHFKENAYDLNLMLKPFLRKSIEWNYEKEWRIVLPENAINQNGGFEPYKPYIKFLKPTKVYLGLNITERNENSIRKICKIKKIPLYKAKKSNMNFDFDFEKVDL